MAKFAPAFQACSGYSHRVRKVQELRGAGWHGMTQPARSSQPPGRRGGTGLSEFCVLSAVFSADFNDEVHDGLCGRKAVRGAASEEEYLSTCPRARGSETEPNSRRSCLPHPLAGWKPAFRGERPARFTGWKPALPRMLCRCLQACGAPCGARRRRGSRTRTMSRFPVRGASTAEEHLRACPRARGAWRNLAPGASMLVKDVLYGTRTLNETVLQNAP